MQASLASEALCANVVATIWEKHEVPRLRVMRKHLMRQHLAL